MGLGVLQSKLMKDVPGTARLEDLEGPKVTAHADDGLKRTADGIILIPQPTDDPNDPLNWPIRRRDAITFLLCMLSVLASTLSPLLAANSITLVTWFSGTTITDIALLTGYHLLGVALAGFFFVASARVWGKRHSFLIGTVFIIISSVWGGCSGHNYKSLVAARFFQGVGLAPFEACVNASVGDLYCVHERGKRMALTNLCLFGGAFFTPVIVGQVTQDMGWEWTFWFVAIFAALILPAVYIWCPETTYNRSPSKAPGQNSVVNREVINLDEAPQSAYDADTRRFSEHIRSMNKRDSEHIKGFDNLHEISLELTNEGRTSTVDFDKSVTPAPWVSRRSLRLFSDRLTDEPFLKILVRPLPLLFHPAILWACLIQGSLIGWTALLGVILAVVMLSPPLSFNATQTGYMYGGAFVGALVGFIMAGLVSDWSTKLLCKRNKGIFEPEFRLVLVIPQLFFGCVGLYGFGYAASNTDKYGWILVDVFFGFVTCGLVLGAVASALYIVDAHADIEVEGFTCLLIFKNMFTFGLTFKAFDWYAEAGIYKLMNTSASIQIGILALTIPMYMFGKKNRAFFTRHDMLKALHLR